MAAVATVAVIAAAADTEIIINQHSSLILKVWWQHQTFSF